MSRAQLPPGYEPGSASYWRITVSLFLAGLVTFASLYSTQPLLPTFVTEFGITPAESALTVAVATLGLGAALLVVGPLSEVRGRRGFMLGSLLAASVLGAGCGVAPGFGWLLVMRTLEGVALAGLPAVAMAYLSEELAPQAQLRAAGIYIGGTALGGMSGRLVAGGLADLLGWRGGLVAVGAASLGVAVLVAWLLPPSRRFVPAPRGSKARWQTTKLLLTDRALLALYGVGAVCLGAFVAVFNAVAFRLTQPPYGFSVGAAGLVYLVYLLGSVTSAASGRAVGRWGRPPVASWGAAVMVLGVLATIAEPVTLLIGGLAVLSAGFFALHGVASGWVASRAVEVAGAPGQASSLYLCSYYAGSSVCGVLAGWAWSHLGWPAVVVLCVTLSAIAYTLTLYLRYAGGTAPAGHLHSTGI